MDETCGIEISQEVYDRLKAEADKRGMTIKEFMLYLLQTYGDHMLATKGTQKGHKKDRDRSAQRQG